MTVSSDNKDDNQKQAYEVGYARPPKKTQYKPGQSGNPKGRKRKPASVREQMQKALSKKVPINEGGRRKLLPLQEVILRNLANMAAKGDLKAAAFVFGLLSSPEHADTEAIDQDSLPPDDQAMFEEVMRRLTDPVGSDQCASLEELKIEQVATTEMTGAPEDAPSLLTAFSPEGKSNDA